MNIIEDVKSESAKLPDSIMIIAYIFKKSETLRAIACSSFLVVYIPRGDSLPESVIVCSSFLVVYVPRGDSLPESVIVCSA